MTDREFWEEQHNGDTDYLGHSDPSEVAEMHMIGDVNRKKVCDFGVGDGRMSSYLSDSGADVTCVDVVQSALDKCDRRAKTCLVSDMKTLGQFDLVIMHLVAQHMSDSDLASVLSDCLGKVSVQFVSGDAGQDSVPKLFSRTQGQMTSIAHTARRKVENIREVSSGCVGEDENRTWSWFVMVLA